MLREAKNEVVIEGILNEVDLEYGSYDKDGRPTEYIRGTVKVLVEDENGGEPMEIPVSFFQNKYKLNGDANGAYESLERAKKEFVSVGACGDREKADRVRITRARLNQNDFLGSDGSVVSRIEVNAPFISKVISNYHPRATFEIEGIVTGINRAMDGDVEMNPPRLDVNMIVPGYKNKLNFVTLSVKEPSYISAIENYWESNEAYYVNGHLDFHTTTKEIKREIGFGETNPRLQTKFERLYVIDGGDTTPLDGEMAFDLTEVQAAINEHKARLEKIKEKGYGSIRKAPSAATGKKTLDLGF